MRDHVKALVHLAPVSTAMALLETVPPASKGTYHLGSLNAPHTVTCTFHCEGFLKGLRTHCVQDVRLCVVL